jgi:hypothetical protein
MTCTAAQIVTLYEDVGMSPEQIAEDQDMSIEVIKLALSQHSRVYRNALIENDECFSTDEYNAAKQAISSLVYADDESTRFRAAKFIINEKKGRNDILMNKNGKVLGQNGIGSINILVINQQMARARKSLEESKEKAKSDTTKVIDVESETKAA